MFKFVYTKLNHIGITSNIEVWSIDLSLFTCKADYYFDIIQVLSLSDFHTILLSVNSAMLYEKNGMKLILFYNYFNL